MRETIVKVGIEASKYVREMWEKKGVDKVIGYHDQDTTRVVDKLSEEYIFDLLEHSGFSFSFVSEESGRVFKGNYDYVVVIDPLDGSSNFISGIPWSSVSIAVFRKDEKDFLNSISGVIAEIFRDRIYSYDEKSSYLNEKLVERKEEVKSRIVLAYYDKESMDDATKIFSKIKGGFKIRTLGSASLDMVLVCTGKALFYFDIKGKLRNVDIAASSNFCSRLGIDTVDIKGKRLNVSISDVEKVGNVMLSSDPALISQLSS
ncbi:inositol monophosphatase [Candidatus Acidianus copahuensis]|uniref:Inositol monophosphatase n=1 Tax=Candidatus Acidianus copahuensis TaxID=1160895 RepID=A0A031LTJ5_9CREN|nr:inositol monophosphatase family protein [Candidatus Acidianus copahuensis]EZQ10829.1 inositol monophosphatase [Candidatus Acidianus copahuensis]